jgi:hypothetical protein
MSVIQSRNWCSSCQDYVLHERHLFGFGWGCLLTVLTGLIFLPIWLMISVYQAFFNPPRCQVCGKGTASLLQLVTCVGLLGGCLVVPVFIASVYRSAGATREARQEAPAVAFDDEIFPAPLPKAAQKPEPAPVANPVPPPAPLARAEAPIPPEAIAEERRPRPEAARAERIKPAAETKPIQEHNGSDPRAKTLLTLGKNWEKNERPEIALKSYRELVAKYPNSAEAKTAKQRIKALGEPK